MKKSAVFGCVLAFLAGSLFADGLYGDKEVFFRATSKGSPYHDYARPFATTFGTMLNAGWTRTVAVPREFAWNVGLSVPWALRMEDDRAFDADGTSYPTYMGKDENKATGNAVAPELRGIADPLFGMALLTFEGGVSWWHTALDVRFFWLPAIDAGGDEYGVSWFGFGLQHDVGHYLPVALPVDFAVAWHGTWWGLDFSPTGKWSGTRRMDGFTNIANLITGIRLGRVEFFGELGWECSMLDLSGTPKKRDAAGNVIDSFEGSGHVVGRNGFRVGLGVSFHTGVTNGLGLNMGAQPGGWLRLFNVPAAK